MRASTPQGEEVVVCAAETKPALINNAASERGTLNFMQKIRPNIKGKRGKRKAILWIPTSPLARRFRAVILMGMTETVEEKRARRLELARKALKEFYAQCFWSYRDDLEITEE